MPPSPSSPCCGSCDLRVSAGWSDKVLGGPTVPAVSWQVNKEEEADENETEWLMEEIQPPAPRPGKDGQENGHVTTKSVKAADALTALHGDEQDSEDEVLTLPEVKVQPPARVPGAEGGPPLRPLPRKVPLPPRVDDRLGLVRGEPARRGRPRAAATPMSTFHDDSDEDLLHV